MPGYVTDVSYTRRFQRELAPAWLDCVAVLSGVRPPRRVAGFSWCDLGCGPGLTTNLLAATHPEGRFVGIDLMPNHIEQASRFAAEAAIRNVRFRNADFASADLGSATFDYIVAHGVYAWIDAASQAALRRLIDRHLAPGGLVYLSYNAMPGWASELPFQRLLLALGATLSGDSTARFAAAAQLVRHVAGAGAPSLAASPIAAHLDELEGRHAPAYLAHEYLAPHWQPLFVTDVRRAMAGIGLQPAGSATLTDNFDSFSLRRAAREVVARITDPDTAELVRDFLMHKRFRRDVFMRSAPPLDNGERRDRLLAMRYALTRPAEAVEFSLKTEAGQVNFDNAAARTIVATLESGPQRFAEPRDDGADDRLANLLALCCSGAVRPVAAEDATVAAVNRAILGRVGKAEEIEYLALSCGTALAAESGLLRALAENRADADPSLARWLEFLVVTLADQGQQKRWGQRLVIERV